MASRQTYECFTCKKTGFPNVRVYLDKKGENGKWLYLNEDMSSHQHCKQREQQQSQQQGQQGSISVVSQSESTQLKVLGTRLEYAISLLERLTKAEE